MIFPLLIIGGGGHAKVVADILLTQSLEIIGYTDPSKNEEDIMLEKIKYLGYDDKIFDYHPSSVKLINGIGSVNLPIKRKDIYKTYKSNGYSFAKVIHPSSIIASNVHISEGVQLMAGTIIQTGSLIGRNTIVNTNASVDHTCIIGNHVHIAPGVTISGGVKIGDGCHVGTGATIIQGIKIGKNSVIGAGSVVVTDVPDDVKVMGVPAKEVL